jgi:hypothetical protein
MNIREAIVKSAKGETELVTTVDDGLRIARIIERVVGSKNFEKQGV